MKIVFVLSVIIATTLLPSAFVSGEGEVMGLKDYEYWSDGNVRSCKVYDARGKLKIKSFCRNDGTVERIEKYDEDGNKVQEGHFDQRGKLKTSLDGWAIMRYEYDDEGRMRAEVSFDELGRPIESRLYSPGGRMVYRQVRDSEKLNPYEEAQMAMYLGGANVKTKNPDE